MSSKHHPNDEININLKIKKPNRALVFFLCILLVLILGVTDYISGCEMSFSIFYLIPISLAVFFIDFKYSLFISVLSALVWYLADILNNHSYSSFLIPIWNSMTRLGYFSLHSFIFSKFMKLYDETKIDSLTDSLTNSINSRLFYELLEREARKGLRTNNPLTLVYFDLDNFKKMNDTFGHLTGDSLLKSVSKTINDNIRPADIFSRLGGDEFALIFPETDYSKSDILIKRLKEIVEAELNRSGWPVTLSMGAITFDIFNLTTEEMVKKTDDLMYEAKKSGKNSIRHNLWK